MSTSNAPVNNLSVGSSMADITPPLGTHLNGDGTGKHRPARDVLEPLYAKALIAASGDRRVCVIALDLTVVMEPYSRRVREAVASALDTTPEAVLVCATQTHSAPSMGAFMLDPEFPIEVTPKTQYVRGSEDAYIEYVVPKAIEAARMAAENARPAEMACGRGLLGDFAFNRRGVRRDGKSIVMPHPFGRNRQPLGPPDLCYIEGPIDPEVGATVFRTGNRFAGMLLHHTCHPVINFGTPEHYYSVSPDWCGAWSEEVRRRVGMESLPVVLNGCCGNVNPWHPFDPDFQPDHIRMGEALADMTDKIFATLHFTADVPVDYRARRIPLYFRDIPRERAAEVDTILSENPQPVFKEDGSGVDPRWFRAASTRSVKIQKEREPAFQYDIQAIRIGDLAIVGWPGEPFVEGQLALKVNSPAAFIQVAHMASHYIGYLPTLEAHTRDGHESNSDVTYWAKLAPGSLEKVVSETRDMIDDLFA